MSIGTGTIAVVHPAATAAMNTALSINTPHPSSATAPKRRNATSQGFGLSTKCISTRFALGTQLPGDGPPDVAGSNDSNLHEITLAVLVFHKASIDPMG